MAAKFEIPDIPPEFIITLPGRGGKPPTQYIRKEGLIYLGHLQGLRRTTLEIIQAPTPENPVWCIMRAEVETDRGVFSDYGTVNLTNKGQVGGQYPVEMAGTRATNRALRQATGCPLLSYDELGIEPTEGESAPPPRREPAAPPARQAPRPAVPPAPPAPNAASPSNAPATPEQIDRIHKLGAALGRKHVADLTTFSQADAAGLIGELVRTFNAQKAGTPSAPLAEPGDTDAAPLKWVEQARALATELINEGGTAPAIPNSVTVGKLRAIKKTLDEGLAEIRANRPPVKIPAYVGTP